MRRYVPIVGLSLLAACGGPPADVRHAAERHEVGSKEALAFLRSRIVPWPSPDARGALVVTDPPKRRVATYDNALVVLVLVRRGAREDASRILLALEALQREDGAVPFSFVLPRPDAGPSYVRSGAVAWVGYAAVEYLDAERGGSAREAALSIARRAAAYLLARQVTQPGDPRDGLVRGGEGVLRYVMAKDGNVREVLEPGDVDWTSTEHNVDTFFFFRALARVTGEARYAEAATRIATGLARSFRDARGQLPRGVTRDGLDELLVLDCASWGSVFLGAAGDRDRADTSAAVADSRYAAIDRRTGARGHRMQARGPVLESPILMKRYGDSLPAKDWAELEAVWPEGSAGVALAALRAGRVARARAILDDLEPLRGPDGALPTSTVALPFLFDTDASVAGTAWVELVRFEIGRLPEPPTFWVP